MADRSTHYSLSFHDLFMVDGFKDAYESQNKKVFEAILFTNGLDTSVGYELVACNHRTINKIEYYGIRVEGFERIDKAWLATGCATIDAQIEACDDAHLRKQLRIMKYQGIRNYE
ncbi:hypothetical protein D3C80_388010 [compost metagenome]